MSRKKANKLDPLTQVIVIKPEPIKPLKASEYIGLTGKLALQCDNDEKTKAKYELQLEIYKEKCAEWDNYFIECLQRERDLKLEMIFKRHGINAPDDREQYNNLMAAFMEAYPKGFSYIIEKPDGRPEVWNQLKFVIFYLEVKILRLKTDCNIKQALKTLAKEGKLDNVTIKTLQNRYKKARELSSHIPKDMDVEFYEHFLILQKHSQKIVNKKK